MIRPEPSHAVRVIPGILPEDCQIGRLGELDYLRHADLEAKLYASDSRNSEIASCVAIRCGLTHFARHPRN
jgi:hypothetical protein